MNDKLTTALVDLATKLGTTVERLWPLLVRREYNEAIAYTFLSLIILILSLLSVRTGVVIMKRDPAYKKDTYERNDSEDNRMFGCAAFILVSSIIAFITVFATIKYGLKIVNPEAAAIDRILEK